MTPALSPASTLDEVLAAIEAAHDARTAEVNARHGDTHAVKLGELRKMEKALKKNPDLARELWASGDSAARLLSTLIARPSQYTGAELDAMLRETATPKEQEWLVNYVVKKNRAREDLRTSWFADPDPRIASSGWALTADRVVKDPEGLDLTDLLDRIEAGMKDSAPALQWEMNMCLGYIGIHHAQHRTRVLEIGERLRVLEDYPTSPGCTSPYVPAWIAEMVSRGAVAQ